MTAPLIYLFNQLFTQSYFQPSATLCQILRVKRFGLTQLLCPVQRPAVKFSVGFLQLRD